MENTNTINLKIGEIIYHNHILEKGIVLDIDPYFMHDINSYDNLVETSTLFKIEKPDFNMPWVKLLMETIDSIIYAPISSISKTIQPHQECVDKKYFH